MRQSVMAVLRQADDWRQGRLVSSEYDETTWAARNYMAFAAQRISVAVHIAAAQEIAEALGLSVAADPGSTPGPHPRIQDVVLVAAKFTRYSGVQLAVRGLDGL